VVESEDNSAPTDLPVDQIELDGDIPSTEADAPSADGNGATPDVPTPDE
jgi:hypothetical protein